MDGMVVEVRYQGIVVARGARARDVTVRGAFVETDAPLPVGTIVTIAPGGGPLLRTRVVRVAEVGAERGMALGWTGLAEDARRYLAAGLAAAPVDAEGGGAPVASAAPTASAAVRAVAAGDDATEPMSLDARTTLTDLTPPPGAVAEEIAPVDELSAPVDVGGGDAAARPDGVNGDGKGKRGKRRRR